MIVALASSPLTVAPVSGSPLNGLTSNVVGALDVAAAVSAVVSVGTIHCGSGAVSGSGIVRSVAGVAGVRAMDVVWSSRPSRK